MRYLLLGIVVGVVALLALFEAVFRRSEAQDGEARILGEADFSDDVQRIVHFYAPGSNLRVTALKSSASVVIRKREESEGEYRVELFVSGRPVSPNHLEGDLELVGIGSASGRQDGAVTLSTEQLLEGSDRIVELALIAGGAKRGETCRVTEGELDDERVTEASFEIVRALWNRARGRK